MGAFFLPLTNLSCANLDCAKLGLAWPSLAKLALAHELLGAAKPCFAFKDVLALVILGLCHIEGDH